VVGVVIFWFLVSGYFGPEKKGMVEFELVVDRNNCNRKQTDIETW